MNDKVLINLLQDVSLDKRSHDLAIAYLPFAFASKEDVSKDDFLKKYKELDDYFSEKLSK